nr:hypothetical protein [Sedimentibacter sp.]
MAKSNFIVRGGADFSAIPKELQKLQGQFNGFSKTIGAGLKIAAASVVVKGLVDFGKESLQVASDLQEVQNVVDVTFGKMSSEVNDFSSNALKQFGLSELSAKKFTSTMGAMLKSSGLTGQTVTDMSIEVAKLTADMASFYNLDSEEVFSKIRSGLSGETEPLKQLGINMSVTNMEAYAMSKGINKAWKEMNQAEQTLLRYNYLLSVTGDSQGDFARTSGSWANQTKLLKEQWKEFMGLIGNFLVKILLPIVKALNQLLEILINVTKEIGKIYTLATGKEVSVDSNNSIADTAIDAAQGEEELADGIGEAEKAAKKATASFDDLNILQSGLSVGNSSFSGLDSLSGKNELNTTIATTKVDDGFDAAKEKGEKYFVWFENRWKGLRQTLEMPIKIPAPQFAEISDPIWKPNYGLDGVPTFVPAPTFETTPNPIYKLNWNIAESLTIATTLGLTTFRSFKSSLTTDMQELAEDVSSSAIYLKDEVVSSAEQMYFNTSTKFKLMKENAITNAKEMRETIATNMWEMQAETSYAISSMGMSIGNSIYKMADNGITNINSFITTTYANLSNWATSTNTSMTNWGNGMIETVSDTANSMASSFIDSLVAMYDKFREFSSATGEKIKGSFSGSFSVSSPNFISPAGLAIGALTILKGALSIPRMAFGAYATGGIINKPTLALMGEGSKKEVVMPMQSNTGWITELATMLIGAMPIQSSSGDIYLTVKIGEDTITEKVVNNINRKSRISGKTIINV